MGSEMCIRDSSYDAVLVSEFASMEDLASYQQNPRHLEISAFCKSIRTASAAVDYEV